MVDNFDVITPLRFLLLLKRVQNEVHDEKATDINFEDILSMESHCDKRRDTLIWNTHLERVIGPLMNLPAIKTILKQVNIDEVFLQKLCGILDVNTFEVRTKNFEVIFFYGFFLFSNKIINLINE